VVEFARPFWLLFLPLIPIFLYWFRKGAVSEFSAGRKTASFLVRGSILCLLTLVLAGPYLALKRQEEHVSVVVPGEATPSTREFIESVMMSLGDRGFVFAYDQDWRPTQILLAGLSAGSQGRMIFLHDGSSHQKEDWLEACKLAVRAGIVIDTVVIAPPLVSGIGFAEVQTPRLLAPRQPFKITGKAASQERFIGVARLYLDGVLISEVPIDGEGLLDLEFSNLMVAKRFTPVEIHLQSLESPGKRVIWQSVLIAESEAPVLLVDSDLDSLKPLREFLESAGFEIATSLPGDLPRETSGFDNYSLVILSDIRADDAPASSIHALGQWIRQSGGGLWLLGGPGTFTSGGYFGSALESLLPLDSTAPEEEKDPVTAIMVVLDRSGSMSARVGNQTKMQLANRGAATVLELLDNKDYLGVLAVDTRAHEILPLARISNKDELAERILGIPAMGGGIYVYTALREAFRQLRDNPAGIKHVIMFADADDAEEQYEGREAGNPTGRSALDLAASMLDENITTSVVALGSRTDKDFAFLVRLTESGGGRFYLTDDPTALPGLFALETVRTTREFMVEEPTFAIPSSRPATAVTGIDWEASPPLLGYQTTRAKPGAEVLLSTESGDPLLAVWSLGAGRVAAFASDLKPRWAAEWLRWPMAGRLAAQTARSLLPGERAKKPAIEVLPLPDERFEILVKLPLETTGSSDKIELGSRLGDEKSDPALFETVGPGIFRTMVNAPETGEVRTIQILGDRSYNIPVVIPPKPTAQLPPVQTEDSLARLQRLSEITGGLHRPTEEQLARRTSLEGMTSLFDLSPWLLLAAILLLPCDIAIRRWPST